MKSVFALGVLAAAPAVQAHYIFTQLMIGGKAIGSDYTYMRKNSNTYMPSFTNDIVNSPNLRCNSGATTGTAQTYTVAAGTKVGFKIWFNEKIEHPGPAMVYMSKAPGELNSYDGSGDWFKVYEDGLCGGTNAGVDTNWCSWQKDNIEFTIPAALPPGNYLTRVEHIGIHEAHVGKAQFYMECAHLKVTGSGTGTPGPLVKIPGMYKATDPGIAYNKWSGNPPAYVIPGPKVWSGGSAKATDETTTPVEAPAAEAPATEAPATEAPVADAPVAEAPPATGGAGAAMWAQCGGQGWSGAKACAAGSCKVINEYYSQCA